MSVCLGALVASCCGPTDRLPIAVAPLGRMQRAVLSLPLVARYDFNELGGSQTADSSGNGNTGTLVGGAGFVPGHVGNAIAIGAGRYVAAPDSPSLRTPLNAVTMEAWVMPTNLAGRHEIVRKGIGSYDLWFYDGILRMTVTDGGMGSTLGCVPNPLQPDAGWHHAAGVYDGTSLATYVDGTQVCRIPGGWPLAYDSVELCMGRDCNYNGSEFLGALDQVTVYAGGATPSQICTAAGRTWTGSACADAADLQPPTSPAPVVAAPPITATRLAVSWSPSTDMGAGLEGYLLERSADNGASWTRLTWTLATSFQDPAPPPGNCLYRVTARDAVGNSESALSSPALVDRTPPTAPGQPSASALLGTVSLSWVASTDGVGGSGVAGYQLSRSANDGVTWAPAGSSSQARYTDAVPPGAYRYRVVATDHAGLTSPPSLSSEPVTVGNSSAKVDAAFAPVAAAGISPGARAEAVGTLANRSDRAAPGLRLRLRPTGMRVDAVTALNAPGGQVRALAQVGDDFLLPELPALGSLSFTAAVELLAPPGTPAVLEAVAVDANGVELGAIARTELRVDGLATNLGCGCAGAEGAAPRVFLAAALALRCRRPWRR